MKMGFRVLVILIAGLIFSLESSFAQQAGFGIRGGLNASYFGDGQYFGRSTLYGYHAGVYGKFGITPSFTFQPELLFSRKGQGSLGTTHVGDANHDAVYLGYGHQLDYLDMPLLLRFNITRGLHFMTGPQFSYLLWSRTTATGPEGTINEQSGDGIKARQVDLGALFGLGYEFDNGFNVGVRYGYGFNRIYSPTDLVNASPRNMVTQFTLGYTFGGRGDME